VKHGRKCKTRNGSDKFKTFIPNDSMFHVPPEALMQADPDSMPTGPGNRRGSWYLRGDEGPALACW
jgi:hypothetical protein